MIAFDSQAAVDGVAVEVSLADFRKKLLEVVSELHDVPLNTLNVCVDGLRTVGFVDGEIALVCAWNVVRGELWLGGKLGDGDGIESRKSLGKAGCRCDRHGGGHLFGV